MFGSAPTEPAPHLAGSVAGSAHSPTESVAPADVLAAPGPAGPVAVPAPSEPAPPLAGPACSPTGRAGAADGSAPAGSTAGRGESEVAPARVAAATSGPGAMPAEAGTVVGMALVEPGRADDGEGALIPGYGHVSMVFVHPSHWSNGYGQHLLRAVHALGYTRTTLWTRRSNERAQRLYAAAGYVPNGRTTHLLDGDEIIQLERRAEPV
ncbi:GNAT family N-acetyltransferase [Dactylosporangium sp. CA-152071]|uniref:GNAT family N-acetyltransferase n=1 Tax=Dactylosporangium sp. CA-152071 TaxID=3239933 RepID=UPI003D93B683